MEYTGLWVLGGTALLFSLLGVWYSRGRRQNPEDFISARSSISLSGAVATIVASGMGAWILFSPPETAVNAGLTGLAGYALGSAAAVMLFAWLGRIMRERFPEGHTLTEWVAGRYGTLMYVIILLVMTFYMAVFLSAELTGIAQAVFLMYRVPLWVTAVIIGLATLAYTVFGGIRATVFTDKVQSMIILPLLLLLFGAGMYYSLGGTAAAQNGPGLGAVIMDIRPHGLGFGLTLIIAIVAAELFNQGNWQRVYLPRSTTIMKKAFLRSGFIILPLVLLAGSFGFFGMHQGPVSSASAVLFDFVRQVLPGWAGLSLLVLAVALIMSSMDTLLNGLVSLYTVNFMRIRPRASESRVLLVAQGMTVLLAAGAIVVAMQGWSVLYLFLIADMVCAAAVFPVFFGLFSRRHQGRGAVMAIISGLVPGIIFFPDPGFRSGSLLLSFGLALSVSALVSLVLTALNRQAATQQK